MPRHQRQGTGWIIAGVIAAAIGFAITESVSRQYGLCTSGIGEFAQVLSNTARANCLQAHGVHVAGLVAIAAGVTAAGGGVLRLFVPGSIRAGAPYHPVADRYLCPNEPRCPHGAVLHDMRNGSSRRCSGEGCGCAAAFVPPAGSRPPVLDHGGNS
jgi:hypothetical protein